MKKQKISLWPFILLTLILLGSALAVAWSFKWWGWIQPWQIVSLSAVAATLAIALSALCYWLVKLNRKVPPSAEELARREQLKALENTLNRQFERAMRLSNRAANPYAKPWFLMLCESTEQGAQLLQGQKFESLAQESLGLEMPVSLWSSEQGVVISLEQFDSPLFEPALERLLLLLGRERARQSLNAALLAVRADTLQGSGQAQLSEQAKCWRNLLLRVNQSTGLNLPCYTVVSDFAALNDMQRLFSSFDDERLEQPLGAAPDITADYDEQWFEQSFQELQNQLLQHTTRGLKAQLNPQYRDSIVLGPYQFALLKTELGDFLRQLFSGDAFSDSSLNFRGYYLCNTQEHSGGVDKLTAVLASQLGYQHAQQSEREVARPLFSKALFSEVIIPQASLVGVNSPREGRYRLWGWCFTSVLLALVAAAVVLLKFNRDYYEALNGEAHEKLVQYRQNLVAEPPNVDDLTGPIFSVSDLRQIRQLYHGTKPWYIVSGLPNLSIERDVDASYQLALRDILLVALRDYLLKDMFVYNKLDDKLKTIELYNLYQLLMSEQRQNPQPLVNYFISSLQAEGESDIATLERFRVLLADALRPGTVPERGDQTLIDIVKASLSQDDISALLYQHLLQRPELSQRVDLRQSLGQKAQLVFTLRDESAYLIPRIFTREGFELLLKGNDFQLASKAVADFEGIVGKIGSASQISKVNRELKQRYISDYIAHWQDFYRAVQWRRVDDSVKLREQLNSVADETFSPLKKLQITLNYHTDLVALTEPSTEEGQEPSQLALERSEIGRQIAQEIARPFAINQQLLKPDEQGLTPIDTALSQMRRASEWLNAALGQQPRGADLLQQLATGGANPVQEMQDLATSYRDHLVHEYLANSARAFNDIAMLEVRAFLNEQWRRNVYSFYRANLAGLYPFNRTATRDVSVEHFNQFFAVDGKVDRFNSQFSGYFDVDAAGQRNLRSFLSGSQLAFNDDLSQFFSAAKDIQQRMYTAGNLRLDFALRAQDMSSALSEITLQGERKLYSYRNGPPLWKSLQWPQPQQVSEDIELQLKSIDKHLLRVSFVGPWSWFKLADAMNARAGGDSRTSLLRVEHDGQSATLLLRVESAKTPFLAGYFARLQLPSAL
ncbi:MAG: type VI secretion system membrane subunit TssM [Pseudomonadales bacterium]